MFTPVALEDDPDFNRKSLRGNIVLRWEYLRGSTLFVVWNMATSDESRAGHLLGRAGFGHGIRRAGESCVRGEAELLAESVMPELADSQIGRFADLKDYRSDGSTDAIST